LASTTWSAGPKLPRIVASELRAPSLRKVRRSIKVAPWAPWEIRRADLEAEPIRGIRERLRRTGELVLPGMASAAQPSLFQ
jgi:hypothetical protein